MRRRLDAFIQQSLVSPLRAFAATVLRPHVPHRVRHWSLDQASHELREARHLLNSRIRANTVTPADPAQYDGHGAALAENGYLRTLG